MARPVGSPVESWKAPGRAGDNGFEGRRALHESIALLFYAIEPLPKRVDPLFDVLGGGTQLLLFGPKFETFLILSALNANRGNCKR